jgi:hypothetical protein
VKVIPAHLSRSGRTNWRLVMGLVSLCTRVFALSKDSLVTKGCTLKAGDALRLLVRLCLGWTFQLLEW